MTLDIASLNDIADRRDDRGMLFHAADAPKAWGGKKERAT